MKNITLWFLLLIFNYAFSQTNSTGEIVLSTTSGLEYSAQIDVTSSEVTLTLIGPSDRWLGLGFGVSSMTSGGDVVIFNGTALTDRTFGGIGVLPTPDSNQDWTITFNDVTGGVRTLTATRALDTGEANDYVFSTSDTSINLVWARGNGSFNLVYHGGSNRGVTSSAFTLDVNQYDLKNFDVVPNPVSSTFEIDLPTGIFESEIDIYNVLGKRVYSKKVNSDNSIHDISNLNSGIYLLRVSSDFGSSTKRLIKQ